MTSEKPTNPFPHAQPAQAVLDGLGSGPSGLDAREAGARKERIGPNRLPRAGRESAWALLGRQINNPLIYVLLGSAALALVMGKPTDAGVVLGVVVLNTLIGFLQEHKAGRAIEALSALVPESATVIRDGQRLQIPAEDLVPGDLVALQSGDKVPADLRLVEVRELRTIESALTGESLPVEKNPAVLPPETDLGDRLNLAFSGTLVAYGTGLGVVTATGGDTELGRISALLRSTTELDTPLTRGLARFGRGLTLAIVAVALLLFAVGLLRGYTLLDASLAAITLAVAAIPEGLPAIISIALAIGVQRMASRKAVIRKLPAVETLGSTTVICSDKTGTLTKNEMTVQELWTPEGAADVEGAGYAPEGRILRNGSPVEVEAPVRALLRAGVLCSDAELREGDGHWVLTGDPTEGALLTAARKGGLDPDALRLEWPRRDAIPFESERKFMATLHVEQGGGRLLLVKGAPEVLLDRCTLQGSGQPLDRAAIEAELGRMAARGQRVLALAEAPDPGTDTLREDHLHRLTLLGLQGMVDPPRPEAMEAVEACRRAGIRVKMITGDHPGTAEAIGRELGLRGPAVTGRDLEHTADEALPEVAERTDVFARVAPEHKLRLVRALQSRGQVVAMTGDGVNDAPALKQADIGVAMGITGTSVSREAADMVLTDDNFASIRAAVEEGRRVYDNLVKSLAFVLPTNLGEALIILVAVLAFPIVDGLPLMPVLPVQILWINLVATVTLALPLAFEAKEPGLMERPPRDPAAPIFSRFLMQRTVVVALLMTVGALALFLYEYRRDLAAGAPPELALREAQTMAVTVVTLMQVFYLLNCRSLRDSILAIGVFSNRLVFLGIGALLILQVAFVHLPLMNRLFQSAPLSAESWAKSILVSALVLPIISLEKFIRRWRRRSA